MGVLTNVYGAHTEGVGDVAGVARAKGELIAALDHGAPLVYNADDPWVADLAQDFRGPEAEFRPQRRGPPPGPGSADPGPGRPERADFL